MKQLFVCGQLTLAWRLIAVFDFHQHGAASTCPTETNGDIRESMSDLMSIENRAADLPQRGHDYFLIVIRPLRHLGPPYTQEELVKILFAVATGASSNHVTTDSQPSGGDIQQPIRQS